MKCTTDSSYCGVVAPNKLVLSVTCLPNKMVKAPYCLLKPVEKRTKFPIIWLLVLGCLLVFNSATANDVRWEVSNHYSQPLAYNQYHLLSESVNGPNLEFIVKGEGDQFEVSYVGRTYWLLAFEPLELGAENILLAKMSDIDDEYQESVLQEAGRYSGWGAKVGYRLMLSERLFSSIQFGGFSWEQTLVNQISNLTRWEGARTGISLYAGLGLEYSLTNEASLSFNWLHFELNHDKFDSLAIKIDYRF